MSRTSQVSYISSLDSDSEDSEDLEADDLQDRLPPDAEELGLAAKRLLSAKSNSVEFHRPNIPPPLNLQSVSWSSGVNSPQFSKAKSGVASTTTNHSSANSSLLSSRGSSSETNVSNGPLQGATHSPSVSVAYSSSVASDSRVSGSEFDYFSITRPLSDVPGSPLTSKSKSHISVYDPVLFNIMELSPRKIAKQIALVDLRFFKKIQREELESLAWNGPERWKKSPNIATWIQRFNNLTLWVSHEILESQNIRRRADKVEHFINIAKACAEFQNFNGLKSILTGLQCTPVYRLQKTWALVGRSKNIFDTLADLMSTENNSDQYRKRLTKSKPPCVPYLGVHLSDITFAIEARSKTVDKAQAKQNLDTLLNTLCEFQEHNYDFTEIPPALEFLSSPKFIAELEPLYEEKNYQISLRLEPKESDPDRPSTPTSESPVKPPFFPFVRSPSKLKESDVQRIPSNLMDDNDSNGDANSAIRMSVDEIATKQGLLIRKDITVDFKRAPNRSWRHFHVVLSAGEVSFYKAKHHEPKSSSFIVTADSFISVASDYKKRKHVLRFLPEKGQEMLLEAETEAEMQDWLQAIEKVVHRRRNPKGDLINFWGREILELLWK